MYDEKSVDEIKLIEEIVNEDSLKAFDIYKVALCIDEFCNLQYENVVRTITIIFSDFFTRYLRRIVWLYSDTLITLNLLL